MSKRTVYFLEFPSECPMDVFERVRDDLTKEVRDELGSNSKVIGLPPGVVVKSFPVEQVHNGDGSD